MNVSEIKNSSPPEPEHFVFSQEQYKKLKDADWSLIHGLIRTLPPLHQTILNVLYYSDYGVSLKQIRDNIIDELAHAIYTMYEEGIKKGDTSHVYIDPFDKEWVDQLLKSPFEKQCIIGTIGGLTLFEMHKFFQDLKETFIEVNPPRRKGVDELVKSKVDKRFGKVKRITKVCGFYIISDTKKHEVLGKLLTKYHVSPNVPSFLGLKNALGLLQERSMVTSIPAGEKSKASEYWNLTPSFYVVYQKHQKDPSIAKLQADMARVEEYIKEKEKQKPQ